MAERSVPAASPAAPTDPPAAPTDQKTASTSATTTTTAKPRAFVRPTKRVTSDVPPEPEK